MGRNSFVLGFVIVAISLAACAQTSVFPSQIAPPSAMAPCETMMTVAFMRPRAQFGIAR